MYFLEESESSESGHGGEIPSVFIEHRSTWHVNSHMKMRDIVSTGSSLSQGTDCRHMFLLRKC